MNSITPAQNTALAHAMPSVAPDDLRRVVEEAQRVHEALAYPTFERLVEAAIAGEGTGKPLAANTERTYRETWRRWQDYIAERGYPAESLHAEIIKAFIRDARKVDGSALSRSSKNRMKAAMVTLMGAACELTLQNPDVTAQESILRRFKVPANPSSDQPDQVRAERRALKGKEVAKVLRAVECDDPKKPLSCARNTAMIYLMFFTGMRRAEIAGLKWDHIDFERKTVYVPHAKGAGKRGKHDRRNYRPLLADRDGEHTVIEKLRGWKRVLESEAGDRVYVFPSIRKGDRLGPDKPISGNAVYNLCVKYDYRPHDARRTVGTKIRDPKNGIQVLGQKNASTFLDHYVMDEDVAELADSLKLDY
jgi:integrase